MALERKGPISMKRIGVDKTNARIVLITAGSVFLVIFFIVASFSLFSQLRYQNRIIKAKGTAVSQLKKNLKARDSLVKSFDGFANAEQNFIGGSAFTGGARDGSNPKLVLDALPGVYDYPALTASLEKIASDQRVEIDSVNGIDEAAIRVQKPGAKIVPVEMPFTLSVTGAYDSIQRTVDAVDKSIRPIQVQKLQITGDENNVSLEITGASYYQPAKEVKLNYKVVK